MLEEEMDVEERMSEDKSFRKLEDVTAVIALAKLEEKDLKPLSQSLFFNENSNDSDFKIIELDSVLTNTITEGNSLIIRGLEDDEAVLCTEDATYELRDAETSNSLLLLSDLVLPDDIEKSEDGNRILEEKKVLSVIHNYYEVRKCQPKTSKILHLLEGSFYRGKEHEVDLKGKLYSFEDLQDIVQCSTGELKTALSEMEAYNINGYWRFLEFDYQFRVLTYILNFIEENSWPLDQIPKDEIIESLSDLAPKEIIEQCFDYYCESAGITNSKGDILFRLKENDVCRFIAKVLLKPTGKFNLEEFLQAWQQSVPEGMTTSIAQLGGLALIDTSENPSVARFFPEYDLPDDPAKRFEILFHVKEKWTLEEITPYIERLSTNKANISALLMRHARAYQAPNGKGRLYSSRHSR